MTAPMADQDQAQALADLYEQWLALNPGSADDPDDDPGFVAAARLIMGLPPLGDYDAG